MNKRTKIILGVGAVILIAVIGGLIYYFVQKSDKDDKDKSDDNSLVVNISQPYGRVRGHELTTASGKKYYSFQSIPYALPPIGKNRFKVTTRHNDIHEILDGYGNKKICMQKLESNPLNLNVTEDCLYLNIYTPRKPGSSKKLLSTLIWIHSGDFISGAGIFEYWKPQFLMDYDIIVVTLNYRLGPFGFLWGGDEIIPGNLGLRDQLFAYNWVHTNIEAFGGDPFDISLGGQGSGAASVSYHMINTRARDSLFSSAIMLSGSSLSPHYYQPNAKDYAFDLAKKIDFIFNSNSTQDLRDLLIKPSAEEIQNAGEEIMDEAGFSGAFQELVWLPVVEGYYYKNAYLQWQMLRAYTVGEIRIVPAMLGFTSEEMIELGSLSNITELAELYDNNVSLVLSKKLNLPENVTTELANEVRGLYTKTTFVDDIAGFIRFLSDEITTPLFKQCYNSSWYNLNVMYQFSYKGSFLKDESRVEIPDTNNVAHGEDLKFIWDDGVHSDPSKWSETDRLVQKRLLTLWTNFMKYKKPTPEPDDLLQNITWEFLNDTGTFDYLNINETLELQSSPRVFLETNEILDQYIDDPLTVF